jgi:hypothetical protein
MAKIALSVDRSTALLHTIRTRLQTDEGSFRFQSLSLQPKFFLSEQRLNLLPLGLIKFSLEHLDSA